MSDDIAAEFWIGVDQFNQRQFYACHDTLEAIWMESLEPQRTFYQGVLQLAVALYHLSNQNLRGATILLGEGTNRLRRYMPTYAEIDVTDLVTQASTLLKVLQQTRSEDVARMADQLKATGDGRLGTSQIPVIARMTSPEG